MLARESLSETEWDGGATAPAGMQFLIVNTYFHRDPDHLPHADRLAPEGWTQGRAREDFSLNHFSHGPQGCPGAHIALGIGSEVLRATFDEVPGLRLASGASLNPQEPLPHALDPYALRFAV
jgi:cytochrome P450